MLRCCSGRPGDAISLSSGHRPNAKTQKKGTKMKTATGFDFEPQPDGTVLVEFFGDDGVTFNAQIVTAEVIRKMPLVAALTDIALTKGADVAREIMKKLGEAKQR